MSGNKGNSVSTEQPTFERHTMFEMISKNAARICCGTLLITLITGCYRMPTEDDYSLIPTTNNPDITREACGSNPMPNGSF